MPRKQIIFLSLSCLIIVIPFFGGVIFPKKVTDKRPKNAEIIIEKEPELEIHEGYVSQKEETLLVKQGRKTVAKVHLGAPVMVAQAEQEEKWGYFQFPCIGRADDGTLIVSWQMKADSHTSYGKGSERPNNMMSKDQGFTWEVLDKGYITYSRGYNVILKNGDLLEVNTPASTNIGKYLEFPRMVYQRDNYNFFIHDSLPNELRGVYFKYIDSNGKVNSIHSELNDKDLLRYSIDGLMPIVWWGNIKQMADHSLFAGVYPAYYLNNKELQTGVSFYHSNDGGLSWNIQGKILFEEADIPTRRGGTSFDEPAFEILPDSTFLCIMRTGSKSPMYRTFSNDQGKTWTKPEPFTGNGVKPQLITLENGTLVLTSGRPGVQVRFCFDESGKNWSAPIDMIPFMNEDGITYKQDVSCGYTSLLAIEPDAFLIVYSDFTTINDNCEHRKSIWCRRITVIK